MVAIIMTITITIVMVVSMVKIRNNSNPGSQEKKRKKKNGACRPAQRSRSAWHSRGWGSSRRADAARVRRGNEGRFRILRVVDVEVRTKAGSGLRF